MSWGIYVHFPYCSHLCSYCDFNVSTPSVIPQGAYTDAVIAELKARASPALGRASTLYIGGGTPSLWDHGELERFVDAVRHVHGLTEGAEVTLEANPQDITSEVIARLTSLGVNRLSIGVQSLRQNELDAIDRRHRIDEAQRAIEAARDANLKSFSLDFMFGLPQQTVSSWRDDLEVIASFEAPHLSVYGLTVEPKTALERRVHQGSVNVASNESAAAMLFAARSVLQSHGYRHYEVSSYARPGFRAQHNSAYWLMRPYVGLGAGAHGFDGVRRWVNVKRPKQYIRSAGEGRFEASSETLDPMTLSFERVMTGLRDLEQGVDLAFDFERYRDAVELELKRGRIVQEGTRIRLNELGLRFMNDVLLSFV